MKTTRKTKHNLCLCYILSIDMLDVVMINHDCYVYDFRMYDCHMMVSPQNALVSFCFLLNTWHFNHFVKGMQQSRVAGHQLGRATHGYHEQDQHQSGRIISTISHNSGLMIFTSTCIYVYIIYIYMYVYTHVHICIWGNSNDIYIYIL